MGSEEWNEGNVNEMVKKKDRKGDETK